VEPRGGDRAVKLRERPPRERKRKTETSRADVLTGMAFSNIVMWAIVLATSQTLGRQHRTVDSAAQAAKALAPAAGRYASVLFALGFIGSGLLAVPVLAGAGSIALAGLMRRDWGYSRRPREAPTFYALAAAGTLGGAALTLVHVNAVKLLVIVAMVNGFLAAPFLVLVMLIAGDRRIMGTQVNGRLSSTLGWLATGLMAASAVALVAVGS
jgi:Mn2+/Fe2+ NRAMP family transporter